MRIARRVRPGGPGKPTRSNPGRAPRSDPTGFWRVAEDDPDSDLYAESSDADEVIGYVVAHALPATVGGRAVLDVLNDDRVL